MKEERIYINQWKQEALLKLGWTGERLPQQRDFQFLSEEIFKETGVSLSPSTLRRLWNNQYKNIPQVHTLNALAAYLGFSDWNHFKSHQPNTEINTEQLVPPKRNYLRWVAGMAVVLFVTFVVFTLSAPRKITSYIPEVSLSIRNQENQQVPATVGFDYDISKAKSPVSIELSWNPYERTVLDPAKSFYTGVYYYPDYHSTKLLNNDSVLLNIPVYVTTESWHALIMQEDYDPRPIYIEKSDFLKQGSMGFEWSDLEGYLLEQPSKLFSVFTFSNSTLERFSADELTLELTFQKVDSKFDPECTGMDVLLKGEKGRARLPVGKRGCFGELGVHFGEQFFSGKTTDLSALTTDLLQPQKLTIAVSGGKVKAILSGNPAFEFDYEKPLGQLKVLKFIFVGLGKVHDVKLSSKEGEVYSEDFNTY